MQWGLAVNWLVHEHARYPKFRTLCNFLRGHIQQKQTIDRPQTYIVYRTIDLSQFVVLNHDISL